MTEDYIQFKHPQGKEIKEAQKKTGVSMTDFLKTQDGLAMLLDGLPEAEETQETKWPQTNEGDWSIDKEGKLWQGRGAYKFEIGSMQDIYDVFKDQQTNIGNKIQDAMLNPRQIAFLNPTELDHFNKVQDGYAKLAKNRKDLVPANWASPKPQGSGKSLPGLEDQSLLTCRWPDCGETYPWNEPTYLVRHMIDEHGMNAEEARAQLRRQRRGE